MSAESVTYTILGFIVVAIVFVWWWLEKSAKCRVRIKEVVSGRKIIRDYKAQEFTDESKVPWWKLMGEKDKHKRLIPLPPEESIEIDRKGNKLVEAWRFEDGTVIFSRDDWDVKQYYEITNAPIPDDLQKRIDAVKDGSKKKEMLDHYKKEVRDKWLKDNKVIAPCEPITTKQRALYLMNIKKAESRQGFDWKQQLIPLASIGALVLIIIALMVFWGDIAAPALEAGKISSQMQQTQLETVQLLKDIKFGQQTITWQSNNPNKAPD